MFMLRRLVFTLSLFLIPVCGFAAIAEVGGGSQRVTGSAGNFDSTTQAYNANVTINNLMVCGGNIWRSPALTGITITDTLSSTWTVVLGPQTSEFVAFIAYAVVPSSGAVTLTINPTGGNNYGTWSCDEFSGIPTSSLVDADGGSSSGNSTTPSDSITTTTSNALILGLIANATNTSVFISPGSGFTTIGETESASWAAHHFEFKIGTSATSYTVDGTFNSAVNWNVQTYAFKESAGGANVTQFYRRRPR